MIFEVYNAEGGCIATTSALDIKSDGTSIEGRLGSGRFRLVGSSEAIAQTPQHALVVTGLEDGSAIITTPLGLFVTLTKEQIQSLTKCPLGLNCR